MKLSKKIITTVTSLLFILSSCNQSTKTLKTMRILQYPDKMTYLIGDKLDLSGLLVYSDDDEQLVTTYTTTPESHYSFSEKDVGEFPILIKKADYKSVSFSVTVENKYFPYYLRVEHEPNKVEYVVGESFSSEGLIIYDSKINAATDDYELDIKDDQVLDSSNIGINTVYVRKNNYTPDSFTINVLTVLEKARKDAKDELNAYVDSLDLEMYSDESIERIYEIRDEYLEEIDRLIDRDAIYTALTQAKEAIDSVKPQTEIVGILVESLPLRTNFTVGDDFSYNGLNIAVDFGGGAKKTISDFTVVEPDMDTVQNDVPVKVKYQEFETTFNINVLEKPLTGKKTVRILATNDIHGQIMGQENRASSATVMTYLKNQRENENTVILDQGDTWQGSVYSNYNHGELLTDLMNCVRYDARTVGNHDFDWGADYIAENGRRSFDGYKTPTLAANVYDYDFENKVVGDVQQSQIGAKTTSFTLENGLKVGVVGTIGKNQITSISTMYVKDYAFVDHINVIKEEATRLRQEGCDIVISSTHAGEEDMHGYGLANYVDLVLCAHTHRREYSYEDGLYFVQYGAYNQNVGDIEIEYDYSTKRIEYKRTNYIRAYQLDDMVSEIDTTIKSIIDKYNGECDEVSKEVVANNVSGSFYSSDTLPNLMCRAIYETAVKENYYVDLAYCNNARASLYSTVWTYADLYQAFPFDNVIYIIEVSYNEMVREIMTYNFVCKSESFINKLDPNKTYTIACLDYLAFHTNTDREFDYFSDNNGRFIGTLSMNYRLLLRQWLLDFGYASGNNLSSADYSSDLEMFNRGTIQA